MSQTGTDLTLILADRVGSLAHAIGALGHAGVNIVGHCGFLAWAGEGILHLVVDDAQRAMSALREVGIAIREERVVLIVDVADRPGALAAALERIAGAGVNVDLTYALADGRIVLGVNDIEKAGRAVAP